MQCNMCEYNYPLTHSLGQLQHQRSVAAAVAFAVAVAIVATSQSQPIIGNTEERYTSGPMCAHHLVDMAVEEAVSTHALSRQRALLCAALLGLVVRYFAHGRYSPLADTLGQHVRSRGNNRLSSCHSEFPYLSRPRLCSGSGRV